MDFHTCIKAVGTGKKHNRELSEAEMAYAMEAMLKQEIYPEQIAAFLLGWRVRVESVAEFRAALKVCERYIQKVPVENAIELGYPYDGKVDNPYLFPLVARFLKQSDLNLVLTGDHLQPSKGGLTVKEVCEAIELPDNLHFFDRARFFPQMSALSEIRRRLGLRTGLNTIEKLHNIAMADYALIGAFHKPFVKKYAEVFGDRYRKLIIVQGNEGTPEIFGKCKYWIVQNGTIEEHHADPARFGIDYAKSWKPISHDDSIARLREPDDGLLALACFNAAFYLCISGRVPTLENGWEILGKSL